MHRHDVRINSYCSGRVGYSICCPIVGTQCTSTATIWSSSMPPVRYVRGWPIAFALDSMFWATFLTLPSFKEVTPIVKDFEHRWGRVKISPTWNISNIILKVNCLSSTRQYTVNLAMYCWSTSHYVLSFQYITASHVKMYCMSIMVPSSGCNVYSEFWRGTTE